MLLIGLAQFDLIDVVQDKHRFDDLTPKPSSLIEAVLVRVLIQATEAACVLAIPEVVECLFLKVLEPWCIGNTEHVSEAENRFLEPVFVRGMDFEDQTGMAVLASILENLGNLREARPEKSTQSATRTR